MDRRNYSAAALAGLGMLLLILDSRCAMESGQQAIELCIRSVIPSLFPFLFLSGLITGTVWGNSGQVLKPAAWIYPIPSGGESLLVASLLGGYPAGAIALGEYYHSGSLNRETGNRLLAYCSNAGPAFLFGMMSAQFPEKWMIWSLWGIHLLSAAMVAAVLPAPLHPLEAPAGSQISLPDHLMRTLRSMAMICGWILLFRIVIGFMDRWFLWLLPDWARITVWGILELSNGCWALSGIDSISLRYIVASAMLAFGGVCVAMQTASAASGLSVKRYLAGKLLQTLFSILLAAAVCRGFGLAAAVICVVFLTFRRICKKRSSIPAVSGV